MLARQWGVVGGAGLQTGSKADISQQQKPRKGSPEMPRQKHRAAARPEQEARRVTRMGL